jgi:hypothetical protein
MEKVFAGWFQKTCFNQPVCTLDTKAITFGNKTYEFNDMISQNCIDRIYSKQITSNYLISVMGCMSDFIRVPIVNKNVHKENVAYIIVGADMLSVFIMYYVFKKLI